MFQTCHVDQTKNKHNSIKFQICEYIFSLLKVFFNLIFFIVNKQKHFENNQFKSQFYYQYNLVECKTRFHILLYL